MIAIRSTYADGGSGQWADRVAQGGGRRRSVTESPKQGSEPSEVLALMNTRLVTWDPQE